MNYSKLPLVEERMSEVLCTRHFEKMGTGNAYVLKREGSLMGTTYNLYVDGLLPPDAKKASEMHECGHIIFGHINNSEIQSSIQKMKLKAAYPKVAKHFKNIQAWEKSFERLIYNVCQDMEVNSKVFTKDEFNYQKALPAGACVWPEDYGFPIAMDANAYVSLALMNPERFLKDMRDEMTKDLDENKEEQQNDERQTNKDGQDEESQEGENQMEIAPQPNNHSEDFGENWDDELDDSSGEDMDDESDSGSGSSDDESDDEDENPGVATENEDNQEGEEDSDEDLDDGSKSDGSGVPSDEESESNSTSEDKDEDWTFSDEELQTLQDFMDAHDEEKNEEGAKELSNDHGSDKGTGGEAQTIQNTISSFGELERALTKTLIKNSVISKRDQLYYYNRNKFNSGVLIPKTRNEEKNIIPTMYIILDVSGSISTQNVSSFCTVFANVAKKINRQSRIILWNTHLVKDYKVKDVIIPYAGGGTAIAKGIEYVQKTYKPSKNDILYIVSDFADDLPDWNEQLAKIKCQKKAIMFDSTYERAQMICRQSLEYHMKDMVELLKNTEVMNYVQNL